MKVLFVTFDAPNFVCGPNSWLKRLLPSLKQQGLEIEVLFFINSDSVKGCDCYNFFTTQSFSCSWFPWGTTTEAKIRWILSQVNIRKPDIFVPNMIAAAFYASRWVRKAHIPTIGILHSDDFFHQSIIDEFVLGCPQYALSSLVSVSDFLYRQVNSVKSTLTSFDIIPYGVPIPNNTTQRHPGQEINLIYAGRLVEEQKNIVGLTLALSEAIRRVPGVKATIYGDGENRPQVEKIIQESGLSTRLKLCGKVESSEIQKYMLDGHIFSLMSSYEGLPIALMEAMACGLVPICTHMKSGIPELIDHNHNGLLINNSVDEFVEAVETLKTNFQCWQKFSVAARQKISLKYSDEVCTKKWLYHLEGLHRSSCSEKKDIAIPRNFRLPPVHPGLAREDQRQESWLKRQMSSGKNLSTRIFSSLKELVLQ